MSTAPLFPARYPCAVHGRSRLWMKRSDPGRWICEACSPPRYPREVLFTWDPNRPEPVAAPRRRRARR